MRKTIALVLALLPCLPLHAGGKKGDMRADVKSIQNNNEDYKPSLQLALRLIKRNPDAALIALPLFINPNHPDSVLRLLILLQYANALPESENKTTLLASIMSLMQTIPTPTKDLMASLIKIIGKNAHIQTVSPISNEDDYVLISGTDNPRPESPVCLESPNNIYALSESYLMRPLSPVHE